MRRPGMVWLHRWENGAAGRAGRRFRTVRGLGRRRRGVWPAVPPVRELILRTVRLLTGRGPPAPHHQFPEQLIHAHRGRAGITTAATATTTVITAMATITNRPLRDAGRFGARLHTAPLRSSVPDRSR
jgi:hypothetical protein